MNTQQYYFEELGHLNNTPFIVTAHLNPYPVDLKSEFRELAWEIVGGDYGFE